MEIGTEIETIKVNNFNRKLKNELDYLLNNGNMNIFTNNAGYDIDGRIKYIAAMLNEKVEIKKEETVQQKKDAIISEIDKYTYKKQWNKLTSFHKIVKLKQFVKEVYGDGDLQTELVNKLVKSTEDGKMNTKKSVIYDPNCEKILSVPCLTVDLTKKTFNLKVI